MEPEETKRMSGWLAVLVLLAVVAAGVYGWRSWQGGRETKAVQAPQPVVDSASTKPVADEPATESAKTPVASTVPAAEATPTTTPTVASELVPEDGATSTSATPSLAAAANIQAAIESGNTAALESYFAPTVRVILAASGGIGNRTRSEAIGDLAYLFPAESWDFVLSEATLKTWASGDYAQYFPTGVLVGKSNEGKVVAFTFSDEKTVTGIFMSASADLL
ncbi:MAG: hypothetical protein ACOYBJ_03290 [Patescibacteria group bacterium]|jgi:hypothetical protein